MSDERFDATRYCPGGNQGHYESYFERANHPARQEAFWIRYTLFSPEGRPEQAIGELWAVYFDGERPAGGPPAITAVRSEVALSGCRFSGSALDFAVGGARLLPDRLAGAAETGADRIEWRLAVSGGQDPLFDLPRELYDDNLPTAKLLVGRPLCRHDGLIKVNGAERPVRGWVGSQNHNWGPRHADHYAWGQVAGFDNAPESFLELSAARFRSGDEWSPFAVFITLRHRGVEHVMGGGAAVRPNESEFSVGSWRFRGDSDSISVSGTISAPLSHFVGLRYRNPPGGSKCCLNSKLARCELRVADRKTGACETLLAGHRAAFEILSDDFETHGIPVAV